MHILPITTHHAHFTTSKAAALFLVHPLILLAMIARALCGRLEGQVSRSVHTVHLHQHVLRLHNVAALSHRCDRLIGWRSTPCHRQQLHMLLLLALDATGAAQQRQLTTTAGAAAEGPAIQQEARCGFVVRGLLILIAIQNGGTVHGDVIAVADAVVVAHRKTVVTDAIRTGRGGCVGVAVAILTFGNGRRRHGKGLAETATRIRADGKLNAIGYLNGARVSWVAFECIININTNRNKILRRHSPTLWHPGRCQTSLPARTVRRVDDTARNKSIQRHTE